MSISKHLLRHSSGHLTRKSNGHLMLLNKLTGDRIENCCASYTRQHVDGEGYYNIYTIFDVPLTVETDFWGNQYLEADYSNKVIARSHTGGFYNAYFDGDLFIPRVFDYNYYRACMRTEIRPNSEGTVWSMVGVLGGFTGVGLGSVSGSTAAGTYNNLIDDDGTFPIKVYV